MAVLTDDAWETKRLLQIPTGLAVGIFLILHPHETGLVETVENHKDECYNGAIGKKEKHVRP